MRDRFVVAIDGTAASGKSTTARAVAKRLNFSYIDTGAMYRALTLKALKEELDISDPSCLAELARDTDISLREERVILDGVDVTDEIRTPEVDVNVSLVSSYPEVREGLVELQRAMGKEGRVVCEGRDIGTVVFPEADLKIFMEANLSERAKRRRKERTESGLEVSPERVKSEVARRDLFDSQREASPLRRAEGAILIDTTDLTIEEQVEAVVREIEKVMG